MSIFPEEQAASLNRVMAKMESCFLTTDQSPACAGAAAASVAAAAAAPQIIPAPAARERSMGSVGVQVLNLERQSFT